jgi:hypothetical protein
MRREQKILKGGSYFVTKKKTLTFICGYPNKLKISSFFFKKNVIFIAITINKYKVSSTFQ